MATRFLRRQRVAPLAVGMAAAGIAFYPTTSLHAEAPSGPESRKPIYDDYEAPDFPSRHLPPSKSPKYPSKRSSPSPTDRLAVQIGKTRLFLYSHVATAENKVNEFMDSILDLESSFTSTIASLAPSPQSGEKLMPGSLYVLVAAMAGSIISRNRNIVLRATVPLAVGIGAGWVVLPITMRNVSNLMWRYEQKFPAIADGHLRTREGAERAWKFTKVHAELAGKIVDEKVSAGREAVEGWVRKGK